MYNVYYVCKVRGTDLYPFVIEVHASQHSTGNGAERRGETAALREADKGLSPTSISVSQQQQQQQHQHEKRVVFLSAWGAEERTEWVEALSL